MRMEQTITKEIESEKEEATPGSNRSLFVKYHQDTVIHFRQILREPKFLFFLTQKAPIRKAQNQPSEEAATPTSERDVISYPEFGS